MASSAWNRTAAAAFVVALAFAPNGCSSDSDDPAPPQPTGGGGSGAGGSGAGGSGGDAAGGSGGSGGDATGGHAGSGGVVGGGGAGGGGGGPAGPGFGELYGECTPGQFDSCDNSPEIACYSIQDAQQNVIAAQCLYWIDETVCTGANDDASCAPLNPWGAGIPQCTFFPDPFWTCTLGCNTIADCPPGLDCLDGALNGGTPELMCIP